MNCLGNLVLLAQEQVVNAASVEPTAAAAGPSYDWKLIALLIGALVLPFILATLIARALRLKEYAGRIGATLFILALSIVPFATQLVNGHSVYDAVTWGIDLAGGTNMVFEVDEVAASAAGKEVTPEVMAQMEGAVKLRINPSGVEEVTVRKVGQNRIEVIVPGADTEKAQQIKERIVNLGNLEFALVANSQDYSSLIQLAQLEENKDKTELYQDGKLVAKWRRSAKSKQDGEWLVGANDPAWENGVQRERKIGDQTVRELLVVNQPDEKKRITGQLLTRASAGLDETGPIVHFQFNSRGGFLFSQLTSAHLPREGTNFRTRLAILLNDELYSAPTINSTISDSGQISGSFTQDEVNSLVSVLNAGALTVPLKRQPVNEYTVSPLLGVDIQQKGLRAIVISVIGVMIVTALYYRAAGIVADICLLLNLTILLGAMAVIDATFTLPGLAGIALTLGMAIDANVLIYERMREELAKGASFRMCIKNGFDKALPTILDSNLTTMITAVVLYYIGTDQVKGFAVTLFVGLAISMFCAVYVGRLIFDIAEKKKWITELKMMNLITAKNVDFVGKRGLFIGVSMIALVIGLLVIGYRGRDNMDIDFRGGSMVTFQFDGDKQPAVEEVLATIQPKFEDAVSLEQLRLPEGNDKDKVLFRLRTLVDDPITMRDSLRDAFAEGPNKLILQGLSVGAIKDIPPLKEGEAATPESRFAGGHEVEVDVTRPISAATLRGEVEALFVSLNADRYAQSREDLAVVNPAGPDTEAVGKLIVRTVPSVPKEDLEKVAGDLVKRLDKQPVFEELNTFAAQVAGDTQVAALAAILLSLAATTLYLWVRFNGVTFGLAAAVACFHDVLITLGVMAIASYLGNTTFGQSLGLQDFKVNLTIVAAVLTVIGYSLNDTIVVFDRIREVRGKNPMVTYEMVNRALNETLPRTLLTSSTTLVVLFVLYFLGGESVRGFSFCLILGILIGTYSSIYVASPVLVWIMNRDKKRRPLMS